MKFIFWCIPYGRERDDKELSVPYISLSIDNSSGEIFDVHDTVILLYGNLELFSLRAGGGVN